MLKTPLAYIMSDTVQDRISKQRRFDESLSEAIDETLTSLGAPVRNTIYLKFEDSFSIPKNELPNHVKEFTDFLYKTFGLGAAHLEIKFMQRLHSKIKVDIEVAKDEWSMTKWISEGMTFEGYVCSARSSYCSI